MFVNKEIKSYSILHSHQALASTTPLKLVLISMLLSLRINSQSLLYLTFGQYMTQWIVFPFLSYILYLAPRTSPSFLLNALFDLYLSSLLVSPSSLRDN